VVVVVMSYSAARAAPLIEKRSVGQASVAVVIVSKPSSRPVQHH